MMDALARDAPRRGVNVRITANQLTISRIVLMPIPVALLLTEHRWLQLVAWALYVVLGVTDYFDGVLARKYGSTRFGRLTDPIADKIYVLLMFLPLALLDLMPAWIAVVILMRDPIITALRSLSERAGATMKTATLAKYKTAIQMIAGGYIMFVGIVRERAIVLAFMSALAALAWLAYVYKGARRGRWDPRLLTMGALMTFAIAVRALVGVETTLVIYALIILVVTWLSAFNYIVGFFGSLGKTTRRKPAGAWWVLYGVESTAVPLFLLVLCFHPDVPVWLPMIVASVELAVGALDNILTTEGHERSRRHVAIKLALELTLATFVVLSTLAPSMIPQTPLAVPLLGAAAFGLVSLATTAIAFVRYAPRIL